MDTGHEKLIRDLKKLLQEAEDFEFHDFKGKNATPKMVLHMRLGEIDRSLKNGEYDNQPEIK